ncbi:Cwf15/Cwc15 cell cycle control protein [Basidiobolus meristosporus CBS 931.73]|uniref:Cwf15/Cwc15 cell cycle control protein n=1 Tax=Basidiobolus meristosporus CBS 931.73 TaxID=1314790 RepID=A0A1Y1Y5G8_9FUNG|nr:Cwf15/Cwc15 cell cycle control protein [Basidiobolus meristosporus CBS 931.73]|eukprot:ORX93262.1 Cwf15/Cwc15 cell cycle control protein [Basidiobolus meristosporus CBS 931.73]
MTTAARPTFDPARGKDNSAPSKIYSARDLANHTKLKFRQSGQGTQEEIDKINLRKQLFMAEREHFESQQSHKGKADLDEQEMKLLEESKNLDADDSEESEEDSEEDGEDSSDDDDDDDDTAELLRELEKIKKERAEEKERLEKERAMEEENKRQEQIATGNPLLNLGESKDFSVKRRWDDDVIFKNQSKGFIDKPKRRFVNDLVRSDFHRKFMSKYIR